MTAGKLHANEIDIDVALVGDLVAAQFPQWAGLPLKPVPSAGTDNAIYRLGQDMAVRLPRIPGAAGQVDKEQTWLPRLAPGLPLQIPLPLGKGKPGGGYPWNWSVYRWLEGENATLDNVTGRQEVARDLAGFITALGRADASGGPAPGHHNFFRGVPLADRDANVRRALADLEGVIDTAAATAAWESALAAPAWSGPGVWVHGDLSAGNLLVREGRLSAVIDFGGLGVGDPACDLLIAWEYFTGDSRDAFRAALGADEATWARGRGWALSVALIALPYYLHSSPVITRRARHMIGEVLADLG
ncbi:aminoglycoside phosphotransferase family protein [Streptomyces hoynatensis]|uniref:Aminoglycoside phosphotransferase family protein n=1 Tax=Streptomyces hoynatensis TaxID=1141874 RepID=A0A3A9ZC40_9ACTN|nr:aminoglycoside phosphotransferase family protein [Streptomyces hoynatensis]RKN44907.1 aminoglycoside phosphotransferase family protein [Streptomyces hoynatensis]